MPRTLPAHRFHLCLLPILMIAGCLTPRNHLTFRGENRKEIYRQKFNSCYMLREPAGDYHFVLLADGVQQQPDQEPGGPLMPVKTALLRQLVHVHVFWRPRKGSKPDNPSSTNAALDWYFIAHAGLPDQSVIHYQGSGYVMLNVSSKSAAVHVRSVALEPGQITGRLRDALGDGNVAGDFVALLDPGEVRDLLAEIKSFND